MIATLLALTVVTAPVRFALVIGQNGSDDPNVATLRYADDDAIATHQLLTEAGVHSLLLVRPDKDTRALHPELEVFSAPDRKGVDRAFALLRRRAQALLRIGAPTELIVYYSGHGDVEAGEGYVVLEGSRLYRSNLYNDILARSLAARNHVIIDACKSYFVAFEKGPGGRRAPHAGGFARHVDTDSRRNTGFILSTSSDRDSHEWARFGAGIFSHEVRSALRGAADADADGSITYAELGAFLVTANRAVTNPRFRPDFVVRPPGGDASSLSNRLLAWPDDSAPVWLDRAGLGHLYIESPDGLRVMDVHARPGTKMRLHVPNVRPLFLRTSDEHAEMVIARLGPLHVSNLAAQPPAYADKGAAHLAFRRLFSEPFAASDVSTFVRGYDAATKIAQQRATWLSPANSWRDATKRYSPWVAGLTAALGTSASVYALMHRNSNRDADQARRAEVNRTIAALNTASVTLFSVAGAASLAWLTATLWPEDDAEVYASPPAPFVRGSR